MNVLVPDIDLRICCSRNKQSQQIFPCSMSTKKKKNKKMYKVGSKLTTKTSGQCRSGIFFVNPNHIPLLFPVFLLLTLNMHLLRDGG